jgi:LSD1 subclass zinc finger protein
MRMVDLQMGLDHKRAQFQLSKYHSLMHWKDLLSHLVCPACKSPLAMRSVAGSDSLKCTSCNRVYPVQDDIPILLIERATLEQ